MIGRADKVPNNLPRAGVLVALAACAAFAPPACEQQRALVTIDVSGDQAFPGVTLKLVANGSTTKIFPDATFSSTQTFRVGLYLPASAGPSVSIVATAQDGSCLTGSGAVSIGGVAAGVATAPGSLLIVHMACVPVPAGTGGDTGRQDAAAGAGGGGGGGANGGVGGNVGAGTGGGGPGLGGTPGGGGTSGGTGGQVAGNLILNGDFSGGTTLWQVTPNSTIPVTYGLMNGAYCVDMTPGGSVSVGWPSDLTQALKLQSGTYYQFAYQVSTSARIEFEAKIGEAVTPYDPDFDETTDVPTATPQTFQHLFSTAIVDTPFADSEGGVVFNLSNGSGTDATTCLDNVSLTQVTN